MAIKLICDRDQFRGGRTSGVRWLDWQRDFEIAQRFWPPAVPLTRQGWDEARDAGYLYCAVIQKDQIVSMGAEFRFSNNAWMLAAVSTAAPYRRQGYARRVATFVTAHILDSGRVATCETNDDNVAMLRTAESIGFRWSEPPVPFGGPRTSSGSVTSDG